MPQVPSRSTVHDVVIEGNTLFDRAALQPLIAAVLGREVTVRDLTGVADAIEAKYRAAVEAVMAKHV